MEIRPDVTASLVEAGCEMFGKPVGDAASHFRNGVPRYNILGWLFQHCMDRGIQISILERDRIVDEVHTRANNTVPFGQVHVLDVASLRELIAKLPENMPVVYQRIEDSHFTELGWKTVPLDWERWQREEVTPELLELHAAGRLQQTRIVNDGEKRYFQETSDYIPAFGAYVGTDDQGRKALCIHAHY